MSIEPSRILWAIEQIVGQAGFTQAAGDSSGGFYSSADAEIFVADYDACGGGERAGSAFAALWAIGDSGEGSVERLEKARCIVLVDWGPGGRPGASVTRQAEYSAHLRAEDWAVAFSHGLLRRARKQCPVVLLLQVELPASSGDHGPSSLSKLSHIRFFPLRRGGVAQLERFAQALKLQCMGGKPEAIDREWSERASASWMGRLAEAGDATDAPERHHMLNNLLGPLALATELDPLNERGLWNRVAIEAIEKDEFGRMALMRAISWNRPLEEMDPEAARSFPIERSRELRILLLDDQASDGWIPVLAHLLGLEMCSHDIPDGDFKRVADAGQLSLWVAARPDGVVKDELSESVMPHSSDRTTKWWPSPLRFSAEVRQGELPAFDEILFLDLRLFTSRDAEWAREAFNAWVREALAEHWSASARHDARRLSGLARLIARRDYTYPVVIWSSTGKREVINMFHGSEAIETALQKPKFDGSGTRLESFRTAFRAAIDDAMATARTRCRLEQFLEFNPARTDASSTYLALRKHLSQASHHRVAFYFDESGTAAKPAKFRLGGLVVIASADPAGTSDPVDDRLAEATGKLLKRFGLAQVELREGTSEPLREIQKYRFKGSTAPALAIRALRAMHAATPGSTEKLMWMQVGMAARPSVPSQSRSDNTELDHANSITIYELTSALMALASTETGQVKFHVHTEVRNVPIHIENWKSWLHESTLAALEEERQRKDLLQGGRPHAGQPRVDALYAGLPPSQRKSVKNGSLFTFAIHDGETRWTIKMQTMNQQVLLRAAGDAAESVLGGGNTLGGTLLLEGKAAESVIADFIPRLLFGDDATKVNVDVMKAAPALVDTREVESLRPLLHAYRICMDDPAEAISSCLRTCASLDPAQLGPNSFVAALLSRVADRVFPNISPEVFYRVRASMMQWDARSVDMSRIVH